jgi:farnesyl-diphosphate farnesyltransferase
MAAKALRESLLYPQELFALIRFHRSTPRVLPEPLNKLDKDYSELLCMHLLNLTSRSFARVIQELDVELRQPVCLFYLILRGLGKH